MYVQGVSTRKVNAIVERLCGSQVSSSLVSRMTVQMDEQLARWRNRPLGEMIYLYLDARYEKVRRDGRIRDSAVQPDRLDGLLGCATRPDGRQPLDDVKEPFGIYVYGFDFYDSYGYPGGASTRRSMRSPR